ncbi:MAG: DUF3413 domain-containing protein [Bacteroidales bacterium]|nr:DUF3413 domain-containing protein [Candidatus Physcocola equi]
MSETLESRRKLLKAGLWMALLNGILLNLISYKHLIVAPPCETTNEAVFIGLYSFTHFLFIASLPYVLVFTPAALLSTDKRKKACMWWGAIAYTIFLLIMVVDAFVYNLYRFHLNHTIIEQIFAPGATQVFEFTAVMFIAAAVILAVLISMEIGLFKLGYWISDKINDKKSAVIGAVLLSIYFGCQVRFAIAYAQNDRAICRINRYLPLSMPMNINGALRKMGMDVPQKHKMNFNIETYKYPRTPLISQGGKGKNIIFITLDSWTKASFDSINCPNIYTFSKKCSLFEHHYSGGNCTRNGVWSMLYGIPGYHWYNFKKKEIRPVLIDELERQGYKFGIYPSASLQNPDFTKTAFAHLNNININTKGSKAWERDSILVDNFIADSQSSNDSLHFMFFFFDSMHSMIMPENWNAPFQPTWDYPQYLTINNETDPKPFVNLYRNMLYYIDHQFKRIIDELERKDLLKNSIIIVTGDHGQEFNENGKCFWGHNGNFSVEQIQVPLLYFDADRQPKTYTHWSSHRDIAPTLLHDELGVTNDTKDYCSGHFLWDTTERTRMVTDGYNSISVTETDGTIIDYFYDGDWQVTDRHLNHLFNKEIDFDLSYF